MTLSGVQFKLDRDRVHVELRDVTAAEAVEGDGTPRALPPAGAGALLPWASVAGAIGSLIAGSAVGLILYRRRTVRSPCEAVRRRYRRLVVDGTAVADGLGERRLEVAAIADLARIAENETQLIFHQERHGLCVYLVPMANGTTAEFVAVNG